jgi:hypothetical protein
MPPVRIRKSDRVPLSSTGCWINATDWSSVDKCVKLLQSATSHCGGDPNASVGVYLKNIFMKRAALWLWTSFKSDHCIVVAFHGADGPTPRYCVCAGIDKAFEAKADAPLASDLWLQAVKQFAAVNGRKKDFYLWYADDELPKSGDRIFEAFTLISDNHTSGKKSEKYENRRWPPKQATWRFTGL